MLVKNRVSRMIQQVRGSRDRVFPLSLPQNGLLLDALLPYLSYFSLQLALADEKIVLGNEGGGDEAVVVDGLATLILVAGSASSDSMMRVRASRARSAALVARRAAWRVQRLR
jgi:hypothetical protein